MHTSKKLQLLLVAGLMGLASLAQAMDSRKEVIDGAALGENFPAGIVLDSSDAFVNPSYMLDYKGLIGMEGTAAVQDLFTGFAYIPLSEIGLPGSLGVQVGRCFGMIKQSTVSLVPSQNINNIDAGLAAQFPTLNVGAAIDGNNFTDLSGVESFGLMYAIGLGDKIKAGLGVNYIGNGVEGKGTPGVPASPDIKKSITDLEVRMGAQMQLGSSMRIAADLGIGLPGYHFSYSSAALTQKSDLSSLNLDTNLRFSMPVLKDVDLVVVGGYAGYGGEMAVVPDTANTAANVNINAGKSDLYVGVGGVLKNPKGLTALQLGMLNEGYTNQVTIPNNTPANTTDNTGYFSFPAISLFGERNVTDWLMLRASVLFASQVSGAAHTAGGVSYNTHGLTSSAIKTALGSTIVFDSFIIESVISKKLLFNGPYLVGGVANTGLNTSVSVGYLF
jgi:hypothetical protein